jgi:hypothetical protein
MGMIMRGYLSMPGRSCESRVAILAPPPSPSSSSYEVLGRPPVMSKERETGIKLTCGSNAI